MKALDPEEEAARALADDRPRDALEALARLPGEALPPEALRIWCRAQLAVGEPRRIRARLESDEEFPPRERRILELYGAIALLRDPEAPPGLILEELIPLRDLLEGEDRARLHEALAEVYLACGGASLASRELERALVAHPEVPRREEEAVLLGLRAGRTESPRPAEAMPQLARIWTLASRGDLEALRSHLEGWGNSPPQRRDCLRALAAFGEALGEPAWVLAGVGEGAVPGIEDAGIPSWDHRLPAYRRALAQLRSGDRTAAEVTLERLASVDGLVGPAAAELLGSLRGKSVAGGSEPPGSGPAQGDPGTRAGGSETSGAEGPLQTFPGTFPQRVVLPALAVSGVPACVAALAQALKLLGIHRDLPELCAKVRLDGADVLGLCDLMELLEEAGIPSRLCEADPETLTRLAGGTFPTILRVIVPGNSPTWALLGGADPELGVIRLVFPHEGLQLELPPGRLARLQEPMGHAAIVLAPPGASEGFRELGLKSSMALEMLDQAAQKARQGELTEAIGRLDRALSYRETLLPAWVLATELRVICSLTASGAPASDLEDFLRRAEQAWPDESWPVLYRARYLLERDRKDEAYRELLRAARLGNVEAEVWTELGDLEEERDRPEEAARAWWRAHLKNPLYARPREQLSRHYRRLRQPEVALALCETALESSERNPYNWEMKGILLGEVGGEREEIESCLRRAMEINPERPYAYGFLCDLYLREGMAQEAIQVLEQGVAHGTDPYPYLIRIAELRFDEQDYAGAIEAAERATQARDDEAVPMALIGACRGRLGEVDAAVDLLRRAIELDPSDAWPVRELAIHLRGVGRTDEALAVLAEGQKHCPEDVGIRAQRALTHEADGDFALGLQAAREALEIAGPDEFEVVRLVARMAHSAGRFPVAEAVWRAAVAASSRPADARKQFLSFLLDVEAFELAEREGRSALHDAPGDEELNAWQGYALVRLGRYDEAIPWLGRALEAAPDYPFARSVLLDALTETGEDARAAEVYEGTRGRLTPLGYECAFVAYARLGRYRMALRAARKATIAVPHAAGFFHRRAARLLLDDLHEFEEALREAEVAVECAPDDHRAHEIHAWSLAALRRFEAAEVAMDRMVQTGARFPELLRFRRYLASRRGDHQGEESCARELAEALASDRRQRRHWIREAAALSLRTDPSGARFWSYVEGVSLSPRDWGTLALQAGLLGLAELADVCLRKAGRSGGADALLARGYLRDWAEDFEGALAIYRRVAEAFPEDHRGGEMCARLLLATGAPKEALPLARDAHDAAGVYCHNACFVLGAAELLVGDDEECRPHFLRGAQLEGFEGPSLLQVLDRWSQGDARGAEVELARVLAWERTLPSDRALARRLAAAATLSHE